MPWKRQDGKNQLQHERCSRIEKYYEAVSLQKSNTAFLYGLEALEMSMKESNVELSIESIIERDVLSEEGIRFYLPKDLKELPIEVLKSVSSTNIYAKKCAEERAERI